MWRDVIEGDARWSCEAADCRSWLASLPADSVHCWVTSPPYYSLRDYGHADQIGREESPQAFVVCSGCGCDRADHAYCPLCILKVREQFDNANQ